MSDIRTYTIPKSSGRVRYKGSAKIPEEKEQRDYLVDMIMTNSRPGESFALSLSRLAKAAAFAGHKVLTPGAVWLCYRIFGEQLSKEYRHGRKCK